MGDPSTDLPDEKLYRCGVCVLTDEMQPAEHAYDLLGAMQHVGGAFVGSKVAGGATLSLRVTSRVHEEYLKSVCCCDETDAAVDAALRGQWTLPWRDRVPGGHCC